MSSQLTSCASFQKLEGSLKGKENVVIADLIKNDQRNNRMCQEALGVTLDFSRQRMDEEQLDILLELAKERQVKERIDDMFSGKHINTTEDRAVLHVALRMPENEIIICDDVNVVKDVHSVLRRIAQFAELIRNGDLHGFSGRKLTNLICVGIGGSYLGSEFLVEALHSNKEAAQASHGRCIRFLANVDPIDLYRATRNLDPSNTLVCIISKTFTTAETMLNARALREWIIKGLGDERAIAQHMCAVSTNLELTSKFGIPEERVFEFWDFVGGRFSVTSAVGVLPMSIHYGYNIVNDILRGCHAMDNHFKATPFEKNLPVLMALVSFYNTTLLGTNSVAVLPYCQALHRFTAHIQQLTMESNGKGVDIDGKKLVKEAGEIYFGEPGTNGQHSFYQLLHQGRVVPTEFIGFIKSQQPCSVSGDDITNHDELMCSFFAQPDALAFGKSAEELRKEGVPENLIGHKTFVGNRPSSVLLLPECTSYNLGLILALYEHRTAVQGFLWGINSFDQWGVELGKVLAKGIHSLIGCKRSGASPDLSSLCGPTQKMLTRYLEN